MGPIIHNPGFRWGICGSDPPNLRGPARNAAFPLTSDQSHSRVIPDPKGAKCGATFERRLFKEKVS